MDELQLDLDAFSPQPKKITFQGKKYEVTLFQDLSYDDVMKLLRIEKDLEAKEEIEDLMALIREQTTVVCPNMPTEVLGKLSKRQMLQIGLVSMEVKPNPPTASGESRTDSAPSEEKDPTSVVSSPEPPASTRG